jgi:hypothetical protein
LICFWLVSPVLKNGFIPVSDGVGTCGQSAMGLRNFGLRNWADGDVPNGRFSRALWAGQGVKIACLAPLGALR